MADVPDAVFAQEMVGPGVAIRPAGGAQEAVAPVDGTLSALRPHAFVVSTGGRGVLVHLGIDTVGLDGAGFTLLARLGSAVHAGEPVLRWSPEDVARRGLSPLCPVVAVEAELGSVEQLAPVGAVVAEGEPLLRWSARRA